MEKTGIVVLYKEKGYTSFDAIRVLKGILKVSRIGHTGTLDPQAEGVLVVCVGKATKAAELLTACEKTYRARLSFGSETDTQDAGGKVTRTAGYTFDEALVRRAVDSFQGGYEQVPPMYSAIWVDGRRLYDLARKGKEVERKPRFVTISSLKILSLSPEEMELEVACSRGTYIRTLCEDIGRKTGYLAHMTALVRTQAGPFTLKDSRTLEQIHTLCRQGRESECLISLDTLFEDCPEWTVLPEEDKYLQAGNYLTYDTQPEWKDNACVRMRLSDGTLAGLYRVCEHPCEGKTRLRAYKMFV